MNFLFVHQNFPGQYLHIVRSLLADNAKRPGTHEIVFMTEPNQNHINGVRKVTYSRPPAVTNGAPQEVREFEMAARRAHAAYKGGLQIKALGFKPDIIIGHHGWGEMLDLVDVFPGVPILGYFEFYYNPHGADLNFDPEFPIGEDRFGAVRAKNSTNLLAIALGQHGQTPTRWQHSTYPEALRSRIRIVEEGVDLDICKPDPALRKKTVKVGKLTVTPRQKLLTYVSRNLEPYRGFHTLMRALPALQKAHPELVVSMVGGDEVSYGAPPPGGGAWRNVLLRELGDKIDLSRVHFMGKVPYEDHLTLLKRSDAHVYFTYPFVASWSLREALACGCVVVGSDTPTVSEFVTHGHNGLLTDPLDPRKLAKTVQNILGDTKQAAKLRANARAYAEANLGMEDYIVRYRACIEEITGKPLLLPEEKTPEARKATPKKAVKTSAKTPAAVKLPAKPKPARPAARSAP